VPEIYAVDTLGLGVFHGAFCHYILRENFTNALLRLQGRLLFLSIFGTRRWMEDGKKWL